jgi:hypothetical protein
MGGVDGEFPFAIYDYLSYGSDEDEDSGRGANLSFYRIDRPSSR